MIFFTAVKVTLQLLQDTGNPTKTAALMYQKLRNNIVVVVVSMVVYNSSVVAD